MLVDDKLAKEAHTAEPWVYCRIEPQSAASSFHTPYSPWISGNGPRIVTGDKGAIVGIHADDFRRIVACVNACKGILTEDLERWGVSLIDKIREDEMTALGQMEAKGKAT